MGFKNLRINISLRVLVLLLAMMGIAYLYYALADHTNALLLSLTLPVQVYFLLKVLDKTNHEISNFLSSIRYDDFTTTYPTKGRGKSMNELYTQFNIVIESFGKSELKKKLIIIISELSFSMLA